MPTTLLTWRKKQKKGSIMEPSTFKEIEASARESGATNPEAVAGAAYWKTAKKKYSAYLHRKYSK